MCLSAGLTVIIVEHYCSAIILAPMSQTSIKAVYTIKWEVFVRMMCILKHLLTIHNQHVFILSPFKKNAQLNCDCSVISLERF